MVGFRIQHLTIEWHSGINDIFIDRSPIDNDLLTIQNCQTVNVHTKTVKLRFTAQFGKQKKVQEIGVDGKSGFQSLGSHDFSLI